MGANLGTVVDHTVLDGTPTNVDHGMGGNLTKKE
jgi:hypothetical protein